jgi:hypothetical protein
MKIVVWLFDGLFNGLLFNGCSMELSKKNECSYEY